MLNSSVSVELLVDFPLFIVFTSHSVSCSSISGLSFNNPL